MAGGKRTRRTTTRTAAKRQRRSSNADDDVPASGSNARLGDTDSSTAKACPLPSPQRSIVSIALTEQVERSQPREPNVRTLTDYEVLQCLMHPEWVARRFEQVAHVAAHPRDGIGGGVERHARTAAAAPASPPPRARRVRAAIVEGEVAISGGANCAKADLANEIAASPKREAQRRRDAASVVAKLREHEVQAASAAVHSSKKLRQGQQMLPLSGSGRSSSTSPRKKTLSRSGSSFSSATGGAGSENQSSFSLVNAEEHAGPPSGLSAEKGREVMALRRQAQFYHATANAEQVAAQVKEYLMSRPAATQTPETIARCLRSVKEAGVPLSREELCQFINLRPSSLLELFLLVGRPPGNNGENNNDMKSHTRRSVPSMNKTILREISNDDYVALLRASAHCLPLPPA